MIISVVIPVIRRELFLQLWEDFKRQSMRISQAVIIDNAQCLDVTELQDAPFSVLLLTPARNISVNPAWNIGLRLSTECDVVALLNDDVRISREFIKKSVRALGLYPEAGVVCPLTEPASKAEELNNIPQPNHPIARMTKREGWAMVIDGDLLLRIPPIPETLRTFCGDDWIWYWSHRLHRCWMKDMANIIHHHVGASMAVLPEIRKTMKAEKTEFTRIIKELDAQ